MKNEVDKTLSEEQVVVERTVKFPVSFEVAAGDNDQDNTGENSNNTTDHVLS